MDFFPQEILELSYCSSEGKYVFSQNNLSAVDALFDEYFI